MALKADKTEWEPLPLVPEQLSEEALEQQMHPVWKGGRIYRESFAMIEENGVCRAPFLYEPERILCVESYDGKIVYKPGRDYTVSDGMLYAVPEAEGGRIARCGWNYLYYDTKEAAERELKEFGYDLGFGPVAATDGRFLSLRAIDHPYRLTDYQVMATYETVKNEETERNRGQWSGFVQQSQLEHLPAFGRKLAAKEPVSVLLYGDSISCGFDCSDFTGLRRISRSGRCWRWQSWSRRLEAVCACLTRRVPERIRTGPLRMRQNACRWRRKTEKIRIW